MRGANMDSKLTAEALGELAGVDAGLALVWLGELHSSGHLTPRYEFFCPTCGLLLAKTGSLDEVATSLRCPRMGVTYDTQKEVHTRLTFEPVTSLRSSER